MIKRNDDRRIAKGVKERAKQAAIKGKVAKWMRLNAYSWDLLEKFFKAR